MDHTQNPAPTLSKSVSDTANFDMAESSIVATIIEEI